MSNTDVNRLDQGDKLKDFRSPPQEERLPELANDHPDPAQPQETPPPVPEQREPQPAEPGAEPPLFKDPRLDIARRAAERRRHLPIDPMSIPDGMAVEGEDELSEDAARAQPPQPPPGEPKFTLRVNRNEFTATRDEILRYAELTPEDAEGLPVPSLIRLAQKNLAAQSFLDESKAYAKSARSAPREPSADQQDDSRPQPAAPLPLGPTDDELEAIQLGEKEDARRAFQEVMNRNIGAALGNFQARNVMDGLEDEINARSRQFLANNPDLANDPFLSDMHRAALAHEALADLRQAVPEMPDDKLLEAMNNNSYAMRVYKAARAEGRPVRPIDEIFGAAEAKLRSRLVGSSQQQSGQAPSHDRREAKRELIQQPARTDVSQQAQPPAQTGRRDPSAIIRNIARARHQE